MSIVGQTFTALSHLYVTAASTHHHCRATLSLSNPLPTLLSPVSLSPITSTMHALLRLFLSHGHAPRARNFLSSRPQPTCAPVGVCPARPAPRCSLCACVEQMFCAMAAYTGRATVAVRCAVCAQASHRLLSPLPEHATHPHLHTPTPTPTHIHIHTSTGPLRPHANVERCGHATRPVTAAVCCGTFTACGA
jgi:hypothetical protein